MKKKMSILAALVLAVIVTGYSVSGTYAKYTTTFNGTTSAARVASWDIDVSDLNSKTITASDTFEFNLFESVNDSNVKKGTGENIIAPGTTGSFAIQLANNSEVTAEYTVEYTVDNKNVPIEYSIDGTNWTTGLANVTSPVTMNMGGTDTITIQWRWAFTGDASENYTASQDDSTDTALGIATTAATPTVSAKIVVNQVD